MQGRLFYIAVAGSSLRETKNQPRIPMKTHPFDLIIGLDRSDRKADLHYIDTRTGRRWSQCLDTTPEALWEWLRELRQQYPQARVALCLEQPAVHLIPFLESYEWLTLYPINPITLQKYREAFVTSRAKDDGKDARYLAELLWNHHEQLPRKHRTPTRRDFADSASNIEPCAFASAPGPHQDRNNTCSRWNIAIVAASATAAYRQVEPKMSSM